MYPKNKSSSQKVRKMKIKKRYGKRNFVQYLRLKKAYTLKGKGKKKQIVFVPGVTSFYRPPKNDISEKELKAL